MALIKINDTVINTDLIREILREPSRDRITITWNNGRSRFYGAEADKIWDEITKAQDLADSV
jgi:hypothetical protein